VNDKEEKAGKLRDTACNGCVKRLLYKTNKDSDAEANLNNMQEISTYGKENTILHLYKDQRDDAA
jgi:hypothetical protein